MQKKSDDFFMYPPNLQMLDLASLVGMYRSRGEPQKASSGEYFACALSRKLVKEAKFWFGLHYSQSAWDKLLTKDSAGYPLTEVEFNILGMAVYPPDDNNHRSHIESQTGFIPQLSFLIVNDLRQFGFLQEYDSGMLAITNNGQKALQGFARRMFDRKFAPEMLPIYRGQHARPRIEQAEKRDTTQTRLF
ncbi:hypothetical protein QA596_05570 [Balneolales bacterium ANBcel1]|nr:hypothetical protein [Balneolales bacterium ANBcel1]